MPIPIGIALLLALLSGLLALLVGLSLRLFGIRKPAKRIARTALLCYLVVLPAFLFVVMPLIFSSLISEASTRPQDRRLEDTPARFGRPFETVRFQTSDAIWLEGWFLPGEPDKPAIILAHGLFRNRQEVLERACLLNGNGYPTLLFDFRHHGSSQASRVTLGWQERLDIIAAARFLQHSIARQKVILMGVSMGAVAVIEAASEMEDSVRAVVADSPFASLSETVARHTRLYLKLPSFPFAHLFTWNFCRLGGFQAADLRPIDSLAGFHAIPVLLLYGSADERMPSDVANQLYRTIPTPDKQLLFFDNAGHGAAFRSHPQEYIHAVLSFLESL